MVIWTLDLIPLLMRRGLVDIIHKIKFHANWQKSLEIKALSSWLPTRGARLANKP